MDSEKPFWELDEEDAVEDEDFFGEWSGECAGCEFFLPVNDIGLCTECATKLDRDLIRRRDWAYSTAAWGLSQTEREKLRAQVIRKYGARDELLAPTRSQRRKSRKKRRK